ATHGSYSLTLTSLLDASQLLSVSSNDIDLWRTGTTFVRPKWGIYRSLNNAEYLRDEVVLFADFCLAKGSDPCDPTSSLPLARPRNFHARPDRRWVPTPLPRALVSMTPGISAQSSARRRVRASLLPRARVHLCGCRTSGRRHR